MDEVRILNQLLAAQSMLHVFPDSRKMGEFVAQALRNIPGGGACSIVLRGVAEVIGARLSSSDEIILKLSNLPDNQDHFSFVIAPATGFEKFVMQTARRSFGYVFLEVRSKEAFDVFKPAARNFINMVAIHLENAWQNEHMKVYQEHLQELVDDRTRELIVEVTERKKAQDQLQRSEQQYRDLIETAQDLIWQTDAEGRYIFLNSAWEDVLGYRLNEILGKRFSDFQDKEQAEKDISEFSRILTGGYVSKYETNYRAKDGRQVTLIFNAKNYLDGSGQAGARGSAYDITARKKAEMELLEARDRLEERVKERTAELESANENLEKAARIKDEFLAAMSHELRTPLTGILGLSDVLQIESYGALNDKQKAALSLIRNSGQRLLALINDILDLSRLEAGTIQLNLQRCSLLEICRASLQKVANQASEKGLHYKLEMEQESLMFEADAQRLMQMLTNLLDNAIKFTPSGGSFGLEVRGQLEKKKVIITVWDTGIGITEEDMPRLFHPFVQLDARLARQYPGTGLGLAMARRLVELHHGCISVQSVLGEGSRFTVCLPWEG